MRKQVLEVVVETIEDFTLEIIVGKGSTACNIKIKLPHFTIVGTTTMPSQVDERLNSFMSAFKFTPYNKKEIGNILSLSAVQKGINLEREAANILAEQCNGNPGEALMILNQVHKYAIVHADGQINSTIVRDSLAVFGSNNNFPISEGD